MLEFIGLCALIYVAFKFGGTIIGLIAKGFLALILLAIFLPVAVVLFQILLSFSAAFWFLLFG
jgi:hypothetical protein